MYKVDLVREVLENCQEIREWYSKEHQLDASGLSTANVREYGLTGKGDLADMILSDGVERGIITLEQVEEIR